MAEFSSSWIKEFEQRLIRGRHIVLHGNITDLFIYRDNTLRMDEYLEFRLKQELGYKHVCWYDPVDKLHFRGEDNDDINRQREEMTAALTQISGNRSGAAPNIFGNVNVPTLSIFSELQNLLCGSTEGAALCIDFGDRMFSDKERFSEDEARLLVRMMKTMQEARVLPTGRMNAVIFLARQLSALPPYLYHNNPFVDLVHVVQPSLDERRLYSRFRWDSFHHEVELEQGMPLDENIVDTLAQLTDGLTLRDLGGIQRTSKGNNIPVENTKELVFFYRFDQKDDPWDQLMVGKIAQAEETLSKDVIGQPEAVGAVVDMLMRARVGISLTPESPKGGRPKGVFFFVGPTGVGKTELAKALTRVVFGDESYFLRLDMSEYAQEHSSEKLTGSPPGYVGYDEGGQLTNWVMRKPFSVILFDEIEKAHPKLLDKFLQVLEDGRLTDNKGQTAFFSQAVLIFTSNIGSATQNVGVETPVYRDVREHFLKEVHHFFKNTIGRPEILNRLGENIIVFDILRESSIRAIGAKFIEELKKSAALQNILLAVDDSVFAYLQELMQQSENMSFGGRRIKALLESDVELPLNRFVFEQGLLEKGGSGPMSINIRRDGTNIMISQP